MEDTGGDYTDEEEGKMSPGARKKGSRPSKEDIAPEKPIIEPVLRDNSRTRQVQGEDYESNNEYAPRQPNMAATSYNIYGDPASQLPRILPKPNVPYGELYYPNMPLPLPNKQSSAQHTKEKSIVIFIMIKYRVEINARRE